MGTTQACQEGVCAVQCGVCMAGGMRASSRTCTVLVHAVRVRCLRVCMYDARIRRPFKLVVDKRYSAIDNGLSSAGYSTRRPRNGGFEGRIAFEHIQTQNQANTRASASKLLFGCQQNVTATFDGLNNGLAVTMQAMAQRMCRDQLIALYVWGLLQRYSLYSITGSASACPAQVSLSKQQGPVPHIPLVLAGACSSSPKCSCAAMLFLIVMLKRGYKQSLLAAFTVHSPSCSLCTAHWSCWRSSCACVRPSLQHKPSGRVCTGPCLNHQ
eukprot:scaffold177257_cov23-Tisochrysis_lutea.AAC.1